MARASQRLIIIKNKNPRTPGSGILISKKTGFQDVTINGKRYYYNIHEQFKRASDFNLEKVIRKNSGIKYNPKIVVRRTNTAYGAE